MFKVRNPCIDPKLQFSNLLLGYFMNFFFTFDKETGGSAPHLHYRGRKKTTTLSLKEAKSLAVLRGTGLVNQNITDVFSSIHPRNPRNFDFCLETMSLEKQAPVN